MVKSTNFIKGDKILLSTTIYDEAETINNSGKEINI